jgi:hypothetical protein
VITQPTATRIIDVVRRELAENVVPVVSDPQAVGSLHMIDHILSTLAVRAEHEIAWLVEETEALEALGRRIVAEAPDATRVAAAVDALVAAPAGSLHLLDVAARYSLAGEILSCALEELPRDSELRASAEAQLDARLAHETAIIGEFQLVGRS